LVFSPEPNGVFAYRYVASPESGIGRDFRGLLDEDKRNLYKFCIKHKICKEIPMMILKGNISLKGILSVLTIASFLTAGHGAGGTAFAQEVIPGTGGRILATEPVSPETPETAAAGKVGEEAGKSVSGGVSVGTIVFSVAMIAATIAIGVIAIGGGSTTTATNH